MTPTKGLSQLNRFAASRNRTDDILQKLLLERGMSVMKDTAHKAVLFEYDAALVQDVFLRTFRPRTQEKDLAESHQER